MCGVLIGLQRNGWEDVPVIAVETDGAQSFAKAMEAGAPVALEGGITSVAKSLGATTASANAVKMSKAHPGTVTPVVVSDLAAVRACCNFADDHRCLVEPACGAALAGAAYDREGVNAGVRRAVVAGEAGSVRHVVAIACGGNIVTRSMLKNWMAALKTKAA